METKTKLIKVDEDVWKKLKEYCNKNNLKIIYIVNDIIENFLKKEGFEK